MSVAIGRPGLRVAGDRRHRSAQTRRPAAAPPVLARHEEAVAQVTALLPVLRSTVEELDHHVRVRHAAAVEYRRGQESLKEG